MCGGSEWRCISLLFSIHFEARNPRQPKTSKKRGVALEVWSRWKILSGVGFFDMADDLPASSLTLLQRCSARTTSCLWGSPSVGALKLVPCSGILWLSWRFHDGNFIRPVLEEQHWQTVEGRECIIHLGWPLGEVSSKGNPLWLLSGGSQAAPFSSLLVFSCEASDVGPLTFWTADAARMLLLRIDH